MILSISLGHNSSAIGFTNDGKIIAGYEEQRFQRLKSTANFPKNAIILIMKLYQKNYSANIKEQKNVLYISHWYDNFQFYKENIIKNQRYDKLFIDRLINEYNFELISLSEEFTHHDAHAYSARLFFDSHNDVENEQSHILIVDGFGNRQQVISIYNSNTDKIDLLQRYYGYQSSLGLLYQYATSFVGMKQNEDQYKFLGYESNIKNVLDKQKLQKLNKMALDYSDKLYNKIKLSNIKNLQKVDYDEKYINIDKLTLVKQRFHQQFYNTLQELFNIQSDNITEYIDNNLDISDKRTIIGYFVQFVVEKVLSNLIDKFKINKIIVAGGVFYNVKVNNSILQKVNRFCAYPLAGDQGCGFGFLKKYHDINYLNFNGFLIGNREHVLRNTINLNSIINIKLSKLEQTLSYKQVDKLKEHIKFVSSKRELLDFCTKKLAKDQIVQVVSGNMEFGPRALCNTSTLALPSADNVILINSLNKRNTVMPMAPVCLYKNLIHMFNPKQFEKIVGSLSYMILTLKYVKGVDVQKYRGVMHNHPIESYYTGRPQAIVDKDHYIYKTLEYLDEKLGYKQIINTSYNVHGTPIVYSQIDAIEDFIFQWIQIKKLKIKKNIYLVIDKS